MAIKVNLLKDFLNPYSVVINFHVLPSEISIQTSHNQCRPQYCNNVCVTSEHAYLCWCLYAFSVQCTAVQ